MQYNHTAKETVEAMAVGKENLRTMVRDMCAAAGIGEKKTNHSSRATSASHLFASNVPENLYKVGLVTTD